MSGASITSGAVIEIAGSDINLFGKGTIDGRGANYWSKGKDSKRPHLMNFSVKGGSISQLSLRDPPMFFITLSKCQDVVVSGLTLNSPSGQAPNTDGIDPGNSDNIVIQNCVVKNDDGEF